MQAWAIKPPPELLHRTAPQRPVQSPTWQDLHGAQRRVPPVHQRRAGRHKLRLNLLQQRGIQVLRLLPSSALPCRRRCCRRRRGCRDLSLGPCPNAALEACLCCNVFGAQQPGHLGGVAPQARPLRLQLLVVLRRGGERQGAGTCARARWVAGWVGCGSAGQGYSSQASALASTAAPAGWLDGFPSNHSQQPAASSQQPAASTAHACCCLLPAAAASPRPE